MRIIIVISVLFLHGTMFSCKKDPLRETLLHESFLFQKLIAHDTVVSKKKDTCRIQIFSKTFLGNEKHNFYGEKAPEKLKVLWKIFLGSGLSGGGKKLIPWFGAGWTGQPLLVLEDSIPFIIQGAYDHGLHKFNAITGKEIWKYKFDDILKGTGTIWMNNNAKNYAEKYLILQGSRQGINKAFADAYVPSFRAVSLITGKEVWRLNSKRTESYSRDVDGSALVVNDTAYIGLENGFFTVFFPHPDSCFTSNKFPHPKIIKELKTFTAQEAGSHFGEVTIESSPVLLGNRIYFTAGSGHVYGYNCQTKILEWDFYIGSDMEGSPVVTDDNCIIVAVEKQFINGFGGALKLNPAKSPDEAVVWFFPTENKQCAEWKGGIIGSVSVNDFYRKSGNEPSLAAFTATDGNLYVVDHKSTQAGKPNSSWDLKKTFPAPKLVYKFQTGGAISTPVFTKNKIIACTYNGIHLFEYTSDLKFKRIDHKPLGSIEATPLVYDHKIFVACRDGYLYCLGDEKALIADNKSKNIETKKIVPEKIIVTENKADKEKEKIISIKEKPITEKVKKDVVAASEIKKAKTSDKTSGNIIAGKYYIIAGSFTIKANAENFKKKMQKEGFTAAVLQKDNKWTVVSLGEYDSKDKAEEESHRIRSAGKEVWVLGK